MALYIGHISFYALWALDSSLEDKSSGMSTFLNEEELNVWWVMNPGSPFLDLKHRNVPCEVTNAVLHFTMSFRAVSAEVFGAVLLACKFYLFIFLFWGIILHWKPLQLQLVA